MRQPCVALPIRAVNQPIRESWPWTSWLRSRMLLISQTSTASSLYVRHWTIQNNIEWQYNNTVLYICTCVTTFLCLLVYVEDPAGAPAIPGCQGELHWLRPHPHPGQWAEGKQERDPDQQLQVHLQPSGLFLHQGGAGEGFPLPTGNNLSLSEHWWHSKDIENRIYVSRLSSPKITYIWKRSYKRRATVIIRSHCHPN